MYYFSFSLRPTSFHPSALPSGQNQSPALFFSPYVFCAVVHIIVQLDWHRTHVSSRCTRADMARTQCLPSLEKNEEHVIEVDALWFGKHYVFSCSMDIIWSNGWGHAVYGVRLPGPLTSCLLPYGEKTASSTLIKLYTNEISGGNGLLWKEQNDYRHFYYSSCIWWKNRRE